MAVKIILPLLCIGLSGLVSNFMMLLYQISNKYNRNKRSIFLIHQACVNFILASITLTMSVHRNGKICGYFGTMYVTFFTVSIYNIAAGSACETSQMENSTV
ncbi:hypothetical protein GJ496_005500 [Pomphorhynchus laevis]|nr:hypothetical protein GJ496_005500 [Pomphorhynchus laevis]